MPKTDHLISTAQAAELLGVDVRTVHRMVDNHRLPAIKVGGNTRAGAYAFERTAVEQLAAERKAAA